MEMAESTYEAPVLEELGTVHELTEGPISGTQFDITFPHEPISI